MENETDIEDRLDDIREQLKIANFIAVTHSPEFNYREQMYAKTMVKELLGLPKTG